MSSMRALLKQRAVRRLGTWIATTYIRLVHATGRWRMVGVEEAMQHAAPPYIVAFWHGRMLMMPYLRPGNLPFRMLSSSHGDGQMIAEAINRFGIETIYGSSRRGGADAMRKILKSLKQGYSIGITPDGPRGPRMRCQGAIADIAKLSGFPMVAAAYSARRRVLASSWDRLLIPFPFSRGVFVVGEPIDVPRDGDSAAALLLLERSLNDVTRRADEMMGVETVEPAVLKLAGDGQT